LEANERFPQGLSYAAATIRAAGYEPGIWVGPFMVGDNSRLFREHPDWMLKDTQGRYIRPWIQYNEPKPWGYRDSDYYVLDTSHPDAMAYLRRVFTTLRGWGFTLFKTDFLFWGLKDSSQVVRHTPGKTSFEYFRDVMAMIRESIGEDARWLGCIAPFMPSIGFVDMMRIGGDVGAQWTEGGFGPTNMLRELTADQYFNDIYWQNDPDAVMLRDFHIHLTPGQIEALAVLEAMSGGAIYTSDPIHQIAQERRDLLRFIQPDGLHVPEYPFWSEMRDETCIIQRLKTHSLVYFFNKTDREIICPFDWEKWLGRDARYLYRRHGSCKAVKDVPFVAIPPRSGVLYYATRTPLAEEPVNMWQAM
ncbi:MAG: alpha-galactosidase, partial [Clostridia bacterium]|nr:alpha-galactosidase [Clostridia bacterium]